MDFKREFDLMRMRVLPRPGLLRCRQAAVMVEFGVVGPCFLFGLLMSFQIALAFMTQEMLDFAMRAAARQVRIGAVTSLDAYKGLVCVNMALTYRCGERLTVQAKSGSSFGGAGAPGLGGSGDFILIRGQYREPWVAQWFSAITGREEATLTSVAAFRNEPY